MIKQNLLVELFVEELPPKALKKLGESFGNLLLLGLQQQDLVASGANVTAFASPRRLAAHIGGVLSQAPNKPVRQRLMPAAVGLDSAGNATPALRKKLLTLGVDASDAPKLTREGEGKSEMLFFDLELPGATLADGLQHALHEAIARLPIPKLMTYQLADGWSSVNFVRPVHRLVALYGSEVIPVSALGLFAGRETCGHRFEAKADAILIRDADSYATQLRQDGAVIASFEERRVEIKRQLSEAAGKQSLRAIDDAALLDEVTGLVERPQVFTGTFDKAFLEVPQECLILTMKANQKYFPLLEDTGRLTDRFLIVSNISPSDSDAIVGGNERVVRARLADAKFFFDQDRKKPLEARVPNLDKVVYHSQLGTQADRVARVQRIVNAICSILAAQEKEYDAVPVGPELEAHHPHLYRLWQDAYQAARLAKADLLTDMVGEFPELQGIMGRYYAQHDGLSDQIAEAIEDHYKPRFAGDGLPRNRAGVILALADKLETLIGLFGIGQLPTGDKDPFALRRQALGVIRLLMEREPTLARDTLLKAAFRAFPSSTWVFPDRDAPEKLTAFIDERLTGVLKERGYSASEVASVMGLVPQYFADVPNQLKAVRAFAALPEAAALAAANKRVANIRKKAEGRTGEKVDTALFREPAETILFDALLQIKPQADAAFESGNYTESLQVLADLKGPVDAFFDSVMVNTDDPVLRNNRLALLDQLHETMNRVADLSSLAA
ncbi:MAG: glycine--tRNA ligase subunit beta [Thiobacillaceae bacterium]